ncbi:hypothetical protein BYT27DRAFT_6689902 [Phlegmacium glaucopus]|nr:hypothetical protein BYT27DRAFT_6689902 [Phlegmacium glaucopus]
MSWITCSNRDIIQSMASSMPCRSLFKFLPYNSMTESITSEPPCYTLTKMPLEIITEIMIESDWHSLLNTRQTCRLLNSISRTHSVWLGQYHQYIAQHMRLARLEEPLNSYSAQELERWVLVRRSADVGWTCMDLKFSRKRWIKHQVVGSSYLVPGGRWLLVGGRDSSVTTYDLDASIALGMPLIPRDDQERQPVIHIAVDIDSPKQSPNLTFTMALSPSFHFSKTCDILPRSMTDLQQCIPRFLSKLISGELL